MGSLVSVSRDRGSCAPVLRGWWVTPLPLVLVGVGLSGVGVARADPTWTTPVPVSAAGTPTSNVEGAPVRAAFQVRGAAWVDGGAAWGTPVLESDPGTGDVFRRHGVPVRHVYVSNSGRRVSAKVLWNQRMIARLGHRDRFNVRLVAFGAGGAAAPVVLSRSSRRKVPPSVQNLTIMLGKSEAKKLRASGDVVLAVSQQYGRSGKHHKGYFRQYATVTDVKPGSKALAKGPLGGRSSAAPPPRAARDCSTIEIKPGADLSNCDLSRANLSVGDLSGVDLTGADMSGTVLTACNLNNAELAGADLTGAVTGGITGTPSSLPDGWTLTNGTLVPDTPGPIPGGPTPAAQVPDAPAAPTASGVGNASVTLNWIVPAGNGSPVSGYNVQVDDGTGSNYTNAAGCTSLGNVLTCTATGLTNGTGYRFKVRASNGAGDSAYSAVGGPFTPAALPVSATDAAATLYASFPKDRPGYGTTDYPGNADGDVPKSYAMVLLGEVARMGTAWRGGEPNLAPTAGYWLLDHADSNADSVVGWGLPVAWDAYDDGSSNPADTEYTITTAIVIDALLSWAERDAQAPHARIQAAVREAIEPYLDGRNASPSGMAAYSLRPADRVYDTFNPAAYMAGQIQRAAVGLRDPLLRQRYLLAADATMRAVLTHRQLAPGSGHWYWNYSVQQDLPNDLPHAGYMIDGIRTYIEHGGRLADQFDWVAVLAHLSDFKPVLASGRGPADAQQPDVQAWPTFFLEFGLQERPARTYDLGIALHLACTETSTEALVPWLLGAIDAYRSTEGRYLKYPRGTRFDGQAVPPLVINEYEAYLYRGLATCATRPAGS